MRHRRHLSRPSGLVPLRAAAWGRSQLRGRFGCGEVDVEGMVRDLFNSVFHWHADRWSGFRFPTAHSFPMWAASVLVSNSLMGSGVSRKDSVLGCPCDRCSCSGLLSALSGASIARASTLGRRKSGCAGSLGDHQPSRDEYRGNSQRRDVMYRPLRQMSMYQALLMNSTVNSCPSLS